MPPQTHAKLHCLFFFLMMLLPPRSTLFPYTTLFRSSLGLVRADHPDLMPPLLEPPGEVVHGVFDPAHVGERSEEHTSELQSRLHLVCRLLLEKKKEIENLSLHNTA